MSQRPEIKTAAFKRMKAHPPPNLDKKSKDREIGLLNRRFNWPGSNICGTIDEVTTTATRIPITPTKKLISQETTRSSIWRKS